MVATNKDAKSGKNSPHNLINPAIVRLLGSRLHPILSGGTLLLTVKGKKSGKIYNVPLNWVPSGDGGLTVFTGKGWSGWWRNVGVEDTPVSVMLRAENLPATARRVENPETVERSLRAFLTRFPSNAKPLSVALGPGRLPDERDLARAARDDGTVMIDVVPREPASETS